LNLQVSFDYGASGNESVGAVCGANNISIEFSDVAWLQKRQSKGVMVAISTDPKKLKKSMIIKIMGNKWTSLFCILFWSHLSPKFPFFQGQRVMDEGMGCLR